MHLPFTLRNLLAIMLIMGTVAPAAQAQTPQTASPGRSKPFTALYRGGTSPNGYYITHQGNKYQVWVRTANPIPSTAPDSLGWYRMTVLDTAGNDRYNLHFAEPRTGARFHLQGDGLMPGSPCFRLQQTAGHVPFIPEPPRQHYQPWEPGYGPASIGGGGANGESICIINPIAPSTLADADREFALWRQQDQLNQQRLDSMPNQIEVTAKPVLYLYPQQAATDIDISLTLAPETRPLCYPALSPAGQWNVTAQPAPDGTLTHRTTGTQYPSLFWEAHLPHQFPDAQYREGWTVRRPDLLPFLEARLAEMNFSYRERTEFIQYWLPVLSAHESVFIHFAFVYQDNMGIEANASGTAYARLAPMGISPAPTHFLRVLMHWMPQSNRADDPHAVPVAQTLPRLNRRNYHALEWGGTRIANSADGQ